MQIRDVVAGLEAVRGSVSVTPSSLLGPRFAGNMERQQTDNLLKPHASGTYLIRERPAEAERFAISIKYVAAARAPGTVPRAVLNLRPPSPPARGLLGWGGRGL